MLTIAPEVKLPKAIARYLQRAHGQGVGSSSSGGGGGGGGSQASHFPHLLTAAAAKCYLATRPLFSYWLQLPLHATMLVTVFERQIQGFVASAKEEVERLTCTWQSSQQPYQKALLAQVRADPYYESYLQRAFASSGASPIELLEAVAAWGSKSPLTGSKTVSGTNLLPS